MSDAYIVRRGKIIQGGGGGFDPNGAVLKVVTSTGCTVTVTGTGYSQTHQNSDGFPRSDDANVTEHFFSIPASAFGDIDVSVSNQYSGETITNSRTIEVETAGKVYEMYITTPNILLDSNFGMQSGFAFDLTNGSYSYDSDYKEIVINCSSVANTSYVAVTHDSYAVSSYSQLKIAAEQVDFPYNDGESISFSLVNKDGDVEASESYGYNQVMPEEIVLPILDARKSPFKIKIDRVGRNNTPNSLTLKELVFS
jgi:hypothetical protein